MADEGGGSEVAETLTQTELIQQYLHHLPLLQGALAQQKVDVLKVLESTQDIRMRKMLEQQAMVWDMNCAIVGVLGITLGMIQQVHQAMGCDVERSVQ